VPAFDQSEATNTLAGAMLMVTPDTPVSATIDAATVVTRYRAIQPPVAARSSRGRSSLRRPRHRRPGRRTPDLCEHRRHRHAFSAMFSDPFTQLGWKPILSYTATSSRTYTLGGPP